jgi:UTP--glucose-1-phosphate uridylyltransferase
LQSKKEIENFLNRWLPEPQCKQFLQILEHAQGQSSKVRDWSSIHSPEDLVDYDSLEEQSSNNYSRLVIGKLNGGLGTSMGCSGPKSLIKVKGEKTFMDLIVEQVRQLNAKWNNDIPLLLMNSFYTDKETAAFLDACDVPVINFKQNMFPRVDAESFSPLNPEEFGWYPPGHGDFYNSMEQQGILQRLIEQGKDILFMSNADNLGAVADTKILNHMVEKKIPFLIEVTPKTPADVKGGTLYEQEGRLKLLEIAQVPDEHIGEFCSQEKFSVFNTNNIWINLVDLQEKIQEGPLNLNVIVNRKTIQGKPVVQLETAIGSALDCFAGAVGLSVSRDRFMPVKKTEDLFLVQSNIFNLDEGRLVRNKERKISSLPVITFGDALHQVDAFQKCFPTIPDLLELELLDISGQVRFEGAASLKGEVKLNGNSKPIFIQKGSKIENESIEC